DDPEADEVKHESRHKPPPVVLLCQPDEGADPAHGHRHGEQLDDQDQPPEVGVLERERVGHVHISTCDGEREQRDHPDAPGGDVATGRRLLADVSVTLGAHCPADRPIAPLAMRSIYVAANLGLPPHITACLFDLDGVITQTATVHAQAWKQVFDEVGVAFDPATDYADYVDGKPRLDGVRSVLAAREVPATPAQDAAAYADAIAGVEAGRAGGFGLVVGVDRAGQADALRKHGADVVVRDLGELLQAA